MTKILMASLLLGGAMVLGCEDTTTTPAPSPTTPTPSPAPMPAPTAAPTMDRAADAARTTTGQAAGAMDNAMGDGTNAANNAGAATAGAMDDVNKTLGGTPQEMIDKAMAFIKENKLTDAQAILDKLEGVKSKLPAEWASKVDSLRNSLNMAKQGAGAMPSAPGMGK